jgi:RNA polymerase sigma-70 factor, ECF subfamily
VDGLDSGLLAQARLGDEAAFMAVYQRHRLATYRFAYRLTASAPAAEDIVQDCFLTLLRNAAFDARQGSLRTYLLGIVRHLAWKRLRMLERETEEAEESADDFDPLKEMLL